MILRKATLLVSLIFIALFMGCNSTTKPNKGVVGGFVKLVGEANHSGITVLIQSANTIPDELSHISQGHSAQVFYSDKHAVFDHRALPALGSTLTDERGFFSLPKVPYGEYIITCFKEGWGFSYSQIILLNESQVNVNDGQGADTIRLNREVLLPVVIFENYVLQPHVCYIAQSNVTFAEGAQLEFSPNSKLLINPNVNVNVLGSCIFPASGSCLITSNSGVYSKDSPAVSLAGGFRITGSSAEIENAVFSYLFDGLVVHHDDVVIRNVAFCRNESGLSVLQSDGVSLTKSLIMGNKSVEYAAVIVVGSKNFTLKNNQFCDNKVSILNRTETESSIEACVFINDSVAVNNMMNSNCSIKYSLIKSASVGIRNSAQGNLTVNFCEINADICVQTRSTLNYGNNIHTGWVMGSNNNLIAGTYTLDFKDIYLGAVTRTLDWTNNYWGTNTSLVISNSIIDTNDLPPSQTYSFSEVVFFPFKSSMITSAGIH